MQGTGTKDPIARTAAAAAQGDATQALTDAAAAQGDATQALTNAATADSKAVAAQSAADLRGTTKTIFATRDMTAASGNVDYTGFGGTPKSVVIRFGIATTTLMGSGESNGTDQSCVAMRGVGTSAVSNTALVMAETTGGGVNQYATASFLADTVRLAWTKTGAPVGTLSLQITARF